MSCIYRWFARFVMVLAIMLWTCYASAEVVFYIDSDAAPGGNGRSPATAWTEPNLTSNQLDAVETEVQNNDVVIMLDNGDEWNYSSAGRIFFVMQGTSSHWITIDGTSWGENSGNVTRAKIKFTNIDDVTPNGLFIANEATIWPENPNNTYDAYLKVTGLEIEGDVSFGKNDAYSCLISTVNANHVWIDNCVVHGTQRNAHAYGIAFRTNPEMTTYPVIITDVKATRNIIFDVASSGIAFYPAYNVDSNGDAISEFGEIDSFLAENNTIYNYGRYFRHGAGIAAISASNGIIRGNRIYWGFRPEVHDVVEIPELDEHTGNSMGINIESRCRRISGVDICSRPTNIVVERNLIGSYEEGKACRMGIELWGSETCIIRNNIIMNTDKESIKINDEQTVEKGIDGVQEIIMIHPICIDSRVYNNTIAAGGVLTTTSDMIYPAVRVAGIDTEFDNNIVYQSGNVMSLKRNDSGSFVQNGHAYNVYFNVTSPNSIAICDGDNCSLSYLYSNVNDENNGWEATAKNTAPGFTKYTEPPAAAGKIGGFAPAYGGSACSSGQNLSTLFTDDFEGRQRMGAWDIGAAICNSAPLVVHIGGEFLQQD